LANILVKLVGGEILKVKWTTLHTHLAKEQKIKMIDVFVSLGPTCPTHTRNALSENHGRATSSQNPSCANGSSNPPSGVAPSPVDGYHRGVAHVRHGALQRVCGIRVELYYPVI
jgi:hypothetical protein